MLQALHSRLVGETTSPRDGGTTDLEAEPARFAPPPECAAADILERDRRFVWHPYTSLRDPDLPLVAVAAEDEFLWLADGQRVIDAISSWWTILHGHRHPVLMAALHEAAQSLDHVQFAGVTHPAAVALAELLLSTAPWPGGRVFFSDNGSTAVEVALKMAYQYWCHQGEPQRTWFVGLEGGYHGDTFGAMSVSRDPLFFGRFEPLLFRAEMVPVSAERLDDALTRHAGKVAAVIVEPLVQGAGGMRMHSAEELSRLAAVAHAARRAFHRRRGNDGWWAHRPPLGTPGGWDRTGLDLRGQDPGRRGAAPGSDPRRAIPGGRLGHSRSQPDLFSRPFVHGPPVGLCGCGRQLEDAHRGSPAGARRMELFWSEALAPLRGHPRVRDVRVCGIIAAVELNLPGGYLAPVGWQLRSSCLEQGVLLRPLGSVLYAMPPLCTSDASLEKIANAMHHAIATLA